MATRNGSKSARMTEVIDIYNKVTPLELESVIRKNMEKILENPDMSSTIPPVIIRSSPGMGKSSIVKQVAEDLGIQFKDVRLSQCESVDIKGLPVPNHDKHTMDWYVNGTWPQDEDSAGILFLDELTSCDKSIQCASYELILDRRLGDLYSLPKKWMIVAAGNTVTDSAVAMPMSSALANRFLHFQLDATTEDWTRWAQQHDVDPAVIGFINFRPELLHRMDGENLEMGWPSPRSWERVSTMLGLYGTDDHESNPTLRKIVYGLVGNAAGVEFMEYYRINKEFDNVLEYMLDPSKELRIPDRADARYAVVSALVYQLWRGKNKEDEDRRIDGFFRIGMLLPPDFAAMALQSAMNGPSKGMSSKCCTKMFHNPMYATFIKKYGSAIRKHIKI